MKTLLHISALLGALALGFALGRFSSAAEEFAGSAKPSPERNAMTIPGADGGDASGGEGQLLSLLQSLGPGSSSTGDAIELHAAISEISLSAVPGLLQEFAGGENSGRPAWIALALVERWAKEQPEEAVRFCQTLKDAPYRATLTSSAVATWAGKDWPSASAWVLAMPECEFKSQIAVTVAESLGEADPQRSLDFLAEASSDNSAQWMGGAATGLIQRWFAGEPDAVLTWARSLPVDSPHLDTISAASLLIAATAPEPALELLAATAPGMGREEAEVSIMRRWEAANPNAFSAWAARNMKKNPPQDAERPR